MPVTDRRGALLGTGLYSPASEIVVRLVSQELMTEGEWQETLRARLRTAIERRRPMLDENNDACRLVFSEADELPGLTADQYAGLVVVQLRHKALDTDAVRAAVAETIREAVGPETILEREDPRIRELEQLSVPASSTLYARSAEPVTSTVFRLNGLQFHFDATTGQKTGAFLDQRENYAAAARYAQGEALDVCTYQGGFALHLARTCRRVTGIDVSRAALEVAERNFEMNGAALGNAEVDWVEADAFDLLRDWSDAGTVYDTIVLDPPAFAKSKRAVEGALRGYRELNLRALKMLRPGGRLVTCSCSHHVEPGGVYGDAAGCGWRCAAARAAAGSAWRSGGSSRGDQYLGDGVFEVCGGGSGVSLELYEAVVERSAVAFGQQAGDEAHGEREDGAAGCSPGMAKVQYREWMEAIWWRSAGFRTEKPR